MHKTITSLSLAALTDPGTTRFNNEDCYLLFDLDKGVALPETRLRHPLGPKGVLVMVSDGMGGANAGEVASSLAVQTVSKEFARMLEEGAEPLDENALKEIIRVAHDKILTSSLDDSKLEGMGATLTLLWIYPQGLWLGHVGDSRLYAYDDEKLALLSTDQTPIGEMQRAGIISKEEARVHPNRNLLEQALGAGMSNVHPQCKALSLPERKRFLLCTDGLSDAFSEEMLHSILKTGKDDPPALARDLIDQGKRHYGLDNLTAVLCDIHLEPR